VYTRCPDQEITAVERARYPYPARPDRDCRIGEKISAAGAFHPEKLALKVEIKL